MNKNTNTKKILFTGPESSGKTLLSKVVATRLEGQWLPEISRYYLPPPPFTYTIENLIEIAEFQRKVHEDRALKKSKLVVCDTGPVVMYVWSKVAFGEIPDIIEDWLKKARYDQVFLCRPDIPWERDPLREHPESREELYQMYTETMEKFNIPYAVVRGSKLKDRLDFVLSNIK